MAKQRSNKPERRHSKHQGKKRNDNKNSSRENSRSQHTKKQNRNSQNNQGSKKYKKPYSNSKRYGKYRHNQQSSTRRMSLDAIFRKYDNLLEKHIQARKKYFEMYYRVDEAQREKLKESFYSTLKQIRQWERKLTFNQKNALEKRNNPYKPDNTYSINHDFDPTPKRIESNGKYKDPHTLISQTLCNFQNDTEESIGTKEDYDQLQSEKKYKTD